MRRFSAGPPAVGSAVGAQPASAAYQYSVKFGEEDEDEISDALEQHSILQQLHTLCYSCEWPDWDYDETGRQERVKCAYSLLNNMILHCPKLDTFEPYTWPD